jgi:23S rRNA (adenine2030-N6)-methyltransferase
MNYRHAFHAGNFADVHKHSVLTRILLHLRLKPAAFRVIDTHAGAARYDLSAPEPSRSGEWRQGIKLVWQARHALPDAFWRLISTRWQHSTPTAGYALIPVLQLLRTVC